jgi:hypothetical protein
MDSNNVVIFPKQNLNVKIPEFSMEEINRNVEMMKHYHIQETLSNLAPIIFNQLEIAGFNISDEEDEDIKDGAFVVESLRSIMCKYYGIYHPFQKIADSVFVPDKEETGALKITDSLNIELKNISNKR